MRRTRVILAAALGVLSSAAGAQAWVAFLHTPPEAQHADADMVLAGSLIGAGSQDRVLVRYRVEGAAGYQTAPVLPAFGDTYEAVIPAAQVQPPVMEYYIEWVGKQGSRVVFASAEAPHRVPIVTEARILASGEVEAGTGPASEPSGGRRELSVIAREAPVTVATLKAQTVTRAPAIVSTISQRDIQRMGARTLIEVLRSVPGLESSRDVQGFYRLGVRGIRSDPEILLLYDGHRLGNLYDGRNLYELPVANIKRIEVIRGPGASLYGAGAFLAVVNVVPADGDGVELGASFDSFLVARGHGAVAMRPGKGLLRFEADVETGRGYRDPIEEDTFGGDREEPAGYTDDGRLLVHTAARGVHKAGSGEVSWTVRGLYQDRAALLGAFDAVGPDSELEWMVLLLDAGYKLPMGSSGELRLRLFGDLQQARRVFQLTGPGFDSGVGTFESGVLETQRHGTHSAGLEAALGLQLFAGNTLTLGLGAARQAMHSWAYGVNVDPATGAPLPEPMEPTGVFFPARDKGLTERLVVGAFLQDEWSVFQALDVTAGVRGDLFIGGVGREDPAAADGTRGVEFAVTPRVGLVLQPADPWTFKALFATAFRVPTFEELTSVVLESGFNRGRFEGDPTLDPVTIQTAEVSAEHRVTSGEHQIRLRVNGFINRFRGRIEAVDVTGVINRLQNRGGEIRVYGVEGEARVDFSPRDRLSGGMAWFRATDLEAPDGYNLLTDVPQLRFVLHGQVGVGPWVDLHLGATFGSERRNNARSTLEALRRFQIPAYALVDTTLQTRPLGEVLVVGLTVRNVLDADYRDDVPRPDRVRQLLPGPGLSGELFVRTEW